LFLAAFTSITLTIALLELDALKDEGAVTITERETVARAVHNTFLIVFSFLFHPL